MDNDDSAQQDQHEGPVNERQSSSALAWLLLYSTAMFTLPFAAFYSTRYALTHYLRIDGFPNTCGSVVAAVLVVNLIILLYALRGYEDAKDDDNPDTPPSEEAERDRKEESKKSK